MGLPVQVDGIAWWYEGDSLIPMPENIRRRIYEETGFDFSGSICEKAKISDLDETAIDAFREKWIGKSGNKRYANMSAEQLLHDCEAITNEGITYAALILFGKREALGRLLPQAEIVFEYRSSNASGRVEGFPSTTSKLLLDWQCFLQDIQGYCQKDKLA